MQILSGGGSSDEVAFQGHSLVLPSAAVKHHLSQPMRRVRCKGQSGTT